MKKVKLSQIIELGDIIKNIKRSYEDDLISFEKFVFQKFVFQKFEKNHINIRFEKTDFPITLPLIQRQSKEGYTGGTKYTLLIKGKIEKEIKRYIDEDQYSVEEAKEVLVKPEDGVVIFYKYNAWYGEETLYVYYKDNDFIKQLEKEYEEYKENFKRKYFREKIFKMSKEERKKIERKIEEIIKNNVHTIIKEHWVGDDCSSNYRWDWEIYKTLIRLLDKNNNEVLSLYKYDGYCNCDTEANYILEIGKDIKAVFYLKTDCDWVQEGFSGPNILICDKNIEAEQVELFFILKNILNRLSFLKFTLKESKVEINEEYTQEYIYEKWEICKS